MPDQGALGPFFHGWRLHIDGGAAPNPGRMSMGAWLCGPDGQVQQSLGWGREGILKATVPTFSEPSFFAVHGDVIGQWGLFVFGFLLLSLLVRRLRGLKAA